MPARRAAATVAALGLAPLALTALAATPAAAHGTLGDPVSRVAQCYAEGAEHPRSDACRAAVAAGGAQALYDWNGIRVGDAAGRHRQLLPDGKLCSANNEEFKGLDLARADWPATAVHSGSYTFKYRVTAPHKGTFTVYLTNPGYDPAKPLAWRDLDLAHPVATATDPVAAGGFYTFTGTLPERTGRQLLYAVWQRSDSPEAFYSCSDVTFGGSPSGGTASPGGTSGGTASSGTASSGTAPGGTATAPSAPAPSASAPTEEQIEAGAAKSTVGHHGHGGAGTSASATSTPAGAGAAPAAPPRTTDARAGRAEAAGDGERLAETGGDGSAPYLAMGGAAALALGSAVLFASVRRRSSHRG